MENLVSRPILSSDLLRGHTDSIVLRLLMKGDAYGFEIYNRILEGTGEQYELKETTLYSSYKRLEAEGAIVSYWGDETQGARRKYYRITGKGRLLFEQNMRDWRFTQKILNDLLEEPNE
ncbi:MAG: PadR family transcriptional regulator [Treponema sp.]|jgi:DNA-binding PadR family transcriptional regulator|nr:PadR family transcriptional regulator [Treponema sp.]